MKFLYGHVLFLTVVLAISIAQADADESSAEATMIRRGIPEIKQWLMLRDKYNKPKRAAVRRFNGKKLDAMIAKHLDDILRHNLRPKARKEVEEMLHKNKHRRNADPKLHRMKPNTWVVKQIP